MTPHSPTGGRPRRRLPRSFRELTPSNHFNPRTFFYHMVWKAWLTRRTGQHRRPVFPRLTRGDVALTWIGHASFLVQFNDLNILIDPNFANWLFLLKRLKRAGLRISDLPPIDLVLLTHAHFDHSHKPTLRRLPSPKVGIMPQGVGELARGLGFSRIIELETWDTFAHEDWRVTLTPCKHWGARTLHDYAARPDGYLYQVITRGFGLMPSYSAELTVEERWAVVAYLRALQLSQRVRLAEAPPEVRARLEREVP